MAHRNDSPLVLKGEMSFTIGRPKGEFDLRVSRGSAEVSLLETSVLFACAYETLSLLSGKRVPPISHICWRHHWLTPVIMTGLGIHLVFGKLPEATVT